MDLLNIELFFIRNPVNYQMNEKSLFSIFGFKIRDNS